MLPMRLIVLIWQSRQRRSSKVIALTTAGSRKRSSGSQAVTEAKTVGVSCDVGTWARVGPQAAGDLKIDRSVVEIVGVEDAIADGA